MPTILAKKATKKEDIDTMINTTTLCILPKTD